MYIFFFKIMLFISAVEQSSGFFPEFGDLNSEKQERLNLALATTGL